MFKFFKKVKHSVFYLMVRNSNYGRKILIKKGKVLPIETIDGFLSKAPALKLDGNFDASQIKVGIVKNGTYFDNYVSPTASWLYYRRFCETNSIPYEIYDIKSDSWYENALSLDVIFWHPNSTPADMYIAENRIYVLEKHLGKTCFPSYHEIWQYEDKNRSQLLYKALSLNYVKTFSSHNHKESLEYINGAKYPFISKTHIGAGSSGVVKVNNSKEARRIVNKTFGYFGKKTFYPYQRQKDYVFFQEFIEDATFDLRIIIVNEKMFGYYRYPNKGDFRASGSGNYEKKAIPKEALELAYDIKTKLNSRLMGVDLMYSESRGKYYIIETSLFNQIDTPKQLIVDGVAGYYDANDNFSFKKGEFWIAELTAEFVISNYLNSIK